MFKILISASASLLMSVGIQAQDFSLLTYNLRYDTEADGDDRWDQRKDFLISQLSFYSPDIFGTQEGLIHQLKAIKEGLVGYEFIGKGRDQGDDKGEFSAIFYNTQTVRPVMENTFWLSETPEVPSLGWDAAIKRVCTYALFEQKSGGQRFYVFNTHLDHMGETARKESVHLLLEKIREINTNDLPLILMGDFNLEPDHEAIQSLGMEMTDAHTLAGDRVFGPTGTFNGFKADVPATRRIDYIFLSRQGFSLKRYAILTATVNGRFPSDHFPVIAVLSFENKGLSEED